MQGSLGLEGLERPQKSKAPTSAETPGVLIKKDRLISNKTAVFNKVMLFLIIIKNILPLYYLRFKALF